MDKNTILFTSPEKVMNHEIIEVLNNVYEALEEKGYDALDQMVGYILSGDPSYITAHKNARNMIRQIERDDLVETLHKNFIDK